MGFWALGKQQPPFHAATERYPPLLISQICITHTRAIDRQPVLRLVGKEAMGDPASANYVRELGKSTAAYMKVRGVRVGSRTMGALFAEGARCV